MNISKLELIALLFDYVNGIETANHKMAEAYKNENRIWSNDEWIYVKDIEVAFRAMKKLHSKGDFKYFPHIKEILLNQESIYNINDCWLRERILDCKQNLSTLYPNQ
ncbi:hypothetical protein [Rheinheimera sp. WS51]|uniref:hypothetical protein n=1 Tax=Rheinheimera sp. WS51 TaxID=3425886 RepID=UPI003D8C7E0A